MTNKIKIPWSYKFSYLISYLFVLLTAVFVGDGVAGGDEGTILKITKNWIERGGNWQALRDVAETNYAASYHLVWVLIQFSSLKIISFFAGPVSAFMESFLLSYHTLGFIFSAVLLLYFVFLRFQMKLPKNVSVLTLTCFFGASYGISFMTGGTIECLLCLLVAIRLSSEWLTKTNKKYFVLLSLVDVLLISTKAYAFLFIILYNLLHFFLIYNREKRFNFIKYYLSIFLPLLFLIFFIQKQLLPDANVYVSLMSHEGGTLSVETVIRRIGYSFFSFSYGLFWTIPFLILAIFGCVSWKEAIAKTIPLFALILFFSLYPFWHGASGIAGNRYLFPFLLFFVPEIGHYLNQSNPKRLKYIACLICAGSLLFFPIVNYRHNLAYASYFHQQSGSETIGIFEATPMWEIGAHPALFSWRVLLANITSEPDISLPGKTEHYATARVIPMTLISRCLHFADPTQASFLPKTVDTSLPKIQGLIFGLWFIGTTLSLLWIFVILRSFLTIK